MSVANALMDFFRMPAKTLPTVTYFGGIRAFEEEKQRVRALNKWIIHPHSHFRDYWQIIMLFAVVITMVVIPLSTSFFMHEIHKVTAWVVLNACTELLFLMDLCLKFRVGLIKEDTKTVDLDLKAIKRNYLKTWFFLDLIAVIPVDTCLLISRAVNSTFGDVAREMRFVKLIKLWGMLRIVRFPRLMSYTRRLEEFHGLDVGQIATFLNLVHKIAIIVLVCHWNACLQFTVAASMDFPKNSWVALDGLVDKPMRYQYTKAMFRSLCQMMSLNYGSSKMPRGVGEIWLVIISMMVGTVIYSLVLAQITILFTNSNSSENVYNAKYNHLKEYMRHKRLPCQFRMKVLDHLESRYQGKWFDEKAILKGLSEPLRREVIRHNCSHLVKNLPAFKDADSLFLTELLDRLEFETYNTGDLIIRRGAAGDCMYFIASGVVEVQTPTFSAKLSDGEYFGEMALVCSGKRTADVVALSPCRLYSLSVDRYCEVLSQFPAVKRQIEMQAEERLRTLSAAEAVAGSSGSHQIVSEDDVLAHPQGCSK